MDERTHDFHSAGAGQGADTEADTAGRPQEGWANQAGAGPDGVSEADALEAAAREIRAREAEAARRAAEQAHTRSVQATQAHHVAMHTASESLGRVIGNAIEASALLTWSPGKFAEMDQLVSTTARNLADFRSHLVLAATAAVEARAEQDTVRDPHDEFPDIYVEALARMREVHRQMGALIALAETDVSNTPALIAMTRSINEAQMLSSVANRGLSLVLGELGMVR